MSEVVNIPQLRFPEFNGGWKESRIGKIYKDLRTGSTPSRAVKSYFKGDNPWITSGELKYNRISTTFEQISDEAIKDTNLVLYQPGTLFIAITGLEAPGTRGKCAINAVPSTTNQSCLAFRKVDSVDTIYMFYWYLKYGKPLYFKYAQGTKQQSFNNKIVEKFQIFLPNKPEQQKIAAFLSAVDNKIEQLSKKQELLGEYKKGLMQQIFSQAIRFKADDGSEFPDWEEKNGNEIFDNISNKNHDSDLPILAITQEHGAIPRDLINYKMIVSDKSVSSYKVVETGDFIISLRSFQGGIEYSNYKGICSPAYIILRPAIEIEKKFYKYYLKTYRYIQDLNRKLEGIRDGKMVSYKYFSEIKLPYPSISEQAKIANFLSSIDNKIEQVGKQLRESKQFKKALLQQMFV